MLFAMPIDTYHLPLPMSDSPLVSIVVPVYNAAQFLRPTLDSICNQTHRNLEIILVNDGSKDDSPAILDEYAARDTRIKVIHKENQGGAAARNDGLDLVTGEFVQVLDADDLFEPDMVETMLAHALEHKADIVTCDAWEEEHFPTHRIRCRKNQDHELARKHLNLPCCNPALEAPAVFFQIFGSNVAWDKLLRTEFIRKHHLRFKAYPLADDLNFSYEALLSAQRVSLIDKALIRYQSWPGSLCHNPERNIYGHFHALLDLRDFIRQGNFPEALYESFTLKAMPSFAWGIYNSATPVAGVLKYVESVLTNFPEVTSISENESTVSPALWFYANLFKPYISLCLPGLVSEQQTDILRTIIDTARSATLPLRILYTNEDGNPVPFEQLLYPVALPVQIPAETSDEERIAACRALPLPASAIEIWPGCDPAPLQVLMRRYKREMLVIRIKRILAVSSDKRRKLKAKTRMLRSRIRTMKLLMNIITP